MVKSGGNIRVTKDQTVIGSVGGTEKVLGLGRGSVMPGMKVREENGQWEPGNIKVYG